VKEFFPYTKQDALLLFASPDCGDSLRTCQALSDYRGLVAICCNRSDILASVVLVVLNNKNKEHFNQASEISVV